MTDKTYTRQELEEMADQLLTADDKKKGRKDCRQEAGERQDQRQDPGGKARQVPCRCSAGRQ